MAESDSDEDDYAGSQLAEQTEKTHATLRCQPGPRAADEMLLSWRGAGKRNEFSAAGPGAAALMSEKERCYRASAQPPSKRHKGVLSDGLFQNAYEKF